MPDTVVPKTQTTSPTTPHFQRFSPRWSMFWAPHHPKLPPHNLKTGGMTPSKPPTRRQRASHGAKPPLPPTKQPHEGPQGEAAVPGGDGRARPQHWWATTGPGRGAGGRRQGQGGPRDRPLRAAGSRVAISRAGRRPQASITRAVADSSDYSPARRSTSWMMRPQMALTHAIAATPRTRERQGRISRKYSKP